MMKSIFISLVTYNGTKITNDCLNSLKKLNVGTFSLHIIVVDNASKEPFVLEDNNYTFPIKIIYNTSNKGFAGGHNIGIEYALVHKADYVLILNNDVLIDPYCIEKLLVAAEYNKKIGITVPKIYFAKGYEFHKDRYKKNEQGKVLWYAGGVMDWDNIIGLHTGVDEVDHKQYDAVSEIEIATGCCMLIKKEVLLTVGVFDERYFLYYEDADFSIRTRRKGYMINFVSQAVVWHKNALSTGGSGSNLQDYFISRNRLLFGICYASFRSRIALLRESLRILRNGRFWQKKGVYDFYSRKFGKGSYRV